MFFIVIKPATVRLEMLAMLINIEKKAEGVLPLTLNSALMSFCVGASPTQKGDIATLCGSLAGAYEKSQQRIHKALATMERPGATNRRYYRKRECNGSNRSIRGARQRRE